MALYYFFTRLVPEVRIAGCRACWLLWRQGKATSACLKGNLKVPIVHIHAHISHSYLHTCSPSGCTVLYRSLTFLPILPPGYTAENMTANDFFDSDTMLIEIILRANPESTTPGSYGFETTVTMDTAEAIVLNWDRSTDITTTLDISSVNTV